MRDRVCPYLEISPAAIARDRALLAAQLAALAGTRWEAEVGAAVAARLEELEGERTCEH